MSEHDDDGLTEQECMEKIKKAIEARVGPNCWINDTRICTDTTYEHQNTYYGDSLVDKGYESHRANYAKPRFCDHCDVQLGVEDRVCESCGAPVTRKGPESDQKRA
jgi:hypothetical protein